MKANINLLRGYDNSHANARSVAKTSAPSVVVAKTKRPTKNRESYFSKPDQYGLPTVYKSKRG